MELGTINWEYRDFLGNLGIVGELTWDLYKITVSNTGRPYLITFWKVNDALEVGTIYVNFIL